MNMKAKASLVLLVMWGMAVCANAAEPAAKPLPADAAVKEPAAITRTTVLPCPIPRPAFDHTKIDRTLKEPKYVSEKPAYRFFAFGPEGKSVMAMVLDESQGTGKGYDVYYLDLNFDRDVTGSGERFACKQPVAAVMSDYKPEKPATAVVCDMNADGKETCTIGLSPDLLKENASSLPQVPALCVNPEPADRASLARKLEVLDPLFDYFVDWGGGKWELRCTLKSGDWHTRSSMYGTGNVWSTDKVWAPVCRFGGMEWDFRQDGLKGKTLKPGDGLVIDTVKPFFAGSSPELTCRSTSRRRPISPARRPKRVASSGESTLWMTSKACRACLALLDCRWPISSQRRSAGARRRFWAASWTRFSPTARRPKP